MGGRRWQVRELKGFKEEPDVHRTFPIHYNEGLKAFISARRSHENLDTMPQCK